MKDNLRINELGEIGLQNFAPYLMNRIMGRYNDSLRTQISELGLTTPKMRALAVLSVKDSLRIGQLATFTVVDHSTLSRALDGMEKDGYVLRLTGPKDNRTTLICITTKGRTVFNSIWPTMAHAYTEMFNDISKNEKRAFVSTLQKILNNIKTKKL